MDYTPEQHSAIYTHDKNLIVVAGAGSGKTRVLVERYLALLDANPDWPLNALVAITFTKKAAGEMRDRVRRSLESRLRAAELLADRARWAGLLAQMDSARIDTIHGLCATILRANAAEAAIDPDFVVLDETAARILLDTVIDDVLATLVRQRDPAVVLFTEYELSKVRAALANVELLDARLDDPSTDLFEQWTTQWAEAAEKKIEHFQYTVALIEPVIPPEIEDAIAEGWWVCSQSLDTLREAESIQDALDALNTIGKINLQGGSAKKWNLEKEDFNKVKARLKDVREAAREALKMIGDPPGDLEYHAAKLLPLWASLLRRVRDAYRQVKDTQGLLDFADLERLTLQLLNAYPHVQARYRGVEFKHLLVDEFQDTNAAQWGIIQALADLQKPSALFVVGDPKQSIYAFRGADVSVFEAVQGQIISAGGHALTMARSFRTHQPLVNCFNSIFGQLLVRDAASPVSNFEVTLGEPLSAERVNPPGPAPGLELLLIDRQEQDAEAVLNVEDRRRWEAYEIAQRLHSLVDEERPIFDREQQQVRPVRYDDMAVLFQAMTNITLYEEMFKAAGLPFVTVAGRGYYDRQEVWDLLNLLRALYNPQDNLALAAALRSPMFNLSDDALLGLRLLQVGAGCLSDALAAVAGGTASQVPPDELEIAAFAQRTLLALRRIAGRVTIAELLQAALVKTGYLAILTGLPDGARRRGNVEKLVDLAEAAGKITLGAFTRYLEDLSSAEVREGEALVEASGTVTLMTVHASKGLEFPVVVLADASRQVASSSRDVLALDAQGGLACKVYPPEPETDEGYKLAAPYNFRQIEYLAQLKEAAESKRRLYVAMTRAQDYLLVSGQGTLEKSAGWLGQLLEILAPAKCEKSTRHASAIDYAYDWGSLRVILPATLPPESAYRPDEAAHAWESEAVRMRQSFPGPIQQPSLLQPVAAERAALARHLAATQIADIGGARYADDSKTRRFYRERVRRKVLHDAPAYVRQINEPQGSVAGGRIGEIVHQALRYWRFPGETDNLEVQLRNYAWGLGIIDDDYLDRAVNSATYLLKAMMKSQVYLWITEARQARRPVYHELPFVYRTDKRIIHGVIDVLFQRPNQSWGIVDYKTSNVGERDHKPSLADFVAHARRFHLQVGIYAAAVQAELGGVVPQTLIHYIRYSSQPESTIEVYPAQWQEALEGLEHFIGNVLMSDEDD